LHPWLKKEIAKYLLLEKTLSDVDQLSLLHEYANITVDEEEHQYGQLMDI